MKIESTFLLVVVILQLSIALVILYRIFRRFPVDAKIIRVKAAIPQREVTLGDKKIPVVRNYREEQIRITIKKKRNEVFFQYWTRKEALLKAMGEGLLFPMDKCDVSLISGMYFWPVPLSGVNRERSHWYLQDLFPIEGYTAAIAVLTSHL